MLEKAARDRFLYEVTGFLEKVDDVDADDVDDDGAVIAWNLDARVCTVCSSSLRAAATAAGSSVLTAASDEPVSGFSAFDNSGKEKRQTKW